MLFVARLRARVPRRSGAHRTASLPLRGGPGAAPIAPEVLEFFIGLGVPVFELYGMTENSAVATANFPGRMKLGTVGEPYPGSVSASTSETGEIQTKHAGTFAGYWNRAGQDGRHVHRRRLADDRGRRRLGRRHAHQDRRPHQAHHHHIGRQEHLAVGDREQPQDVAVRQGGHGDRRPAQVPHRADRHRVRHRRRLGPATQPPVHDLPRPVEKPEVVELIQSVVDAPTRSFASVEQIKKFRCCPKSSITRTAS